MPNEKKCKIGEGEFLLVLPLFDNEMDESGKPLNKIKPKEYQPFLKQMNERFGGNSAWRIKGCFVEKGNTQCENNVTITAFRDFENPFMDMSGLSCKERSKQLNDDYKAVKEMGKTARKRFGQSGVTVIYNKITDATIIAGKGRKSISPKRTTKRFKPIEDIF